jgi:hypothetical protein
MFKQCLGPSWYKQQSYELKHLCFAHVISSISMCNCLAPTQPLVRLAFAGHVACSMAKQQALAAWWEPEAEPTSGATWSQRLSVEQEATRADLEMYGNWLPYQWEPWLMQLGPEGTKELAGFGWTKLAWMDWYIKMSIMRKEQKEARVERDEERRVQDDPSAVILLHWLWLMQLGPEGTKNPAGFGWTKIAWMEWYIKMSINTRIEQAGLRRLRSRGRSRNRSPDR